MQPGERVTVTCVDLDDDGAGVTGGAVTPARARRGRAARRARRRPWSSTSRRTARRAWARLATIETPSPARRPPACRAFGACGGCVLQHLDYEAQLTWKRARVARALAAIDVAVDACVASPRRSATAIGRSWWRPATAAVWCWAPTRPARTTSSIPRAARIAEPPLDDTATALAALLDQAGVAAYDERTLIGDLRHVVLRASHDGRVLATWVTTRPLPDGPALASAFRAARPEVVGVVEHVNRGRGNAIFAADASDDRVLAGAGDDRGSRGRGRPRRPAAALGRRLLPGQPRRRRAGLRRDRRRAGGSPGRTRRRRLLRHRAGSPSRSRAAARRRCSASKSTRAPSPTPPPRRR